MVVATIFIALKGDMDLRKLGRYCDLLVGIFMIILGCYGVVGAVKTYNEKRTKRDLDIVVRLESFVRNCGEKSLKNVQCVYGCSSNSGTKTGSNRDFSSLSSARDEEVQLINDLIVPGKFIKSFKSSKPRFRRRNCFNFI